MFKDLIKMLTRTKHNFCTKLVTIVTSKHCYKQCCGLAISSRKKIWNGASGSFLLSFNMCLIFSLNFFNIEALGSTLLIAALFNECFTCILNCTNSIKLHKAAQIVTRTPDKGINLLTLPPY